MSEGKIEVQLLEWMGSDRSVATSAWTSSYDKSKSDLRSDEDVARVVRMLITSGHSVPVESVLFRFWFRMPIFTDRQHVTHRIASHSGLSGRYRTIPDDWFSIPQDVKEILVKLDPKIGLDIEIDYEELMETENQLYRRWLGHLKDGEKENRITNAEYKRCREVLRGVIGTSNMTERVTVLNLRSFANYVRLRADPHAQTEIRQVANMMLDLVDNAKICPVTIECLKEVGWRI